MKGFKDLDVSYIDAISNLLNEEDSEYDKVFKAAMDKFGISSPDELGSDEERKKFFNYVDSQYVSKGEKNESYASDYKKHAAQHPEQDMTEDEDWRDENEYGDAAKKAVKESKFLGKKFSSSETILKESDKSTQISGYNKWRFPTHDELKKSGTNVNYEKAKTATVIDLPSYLYKKGGGFEPHTKKTLSEPLSQNEKKILTGYTKGQAIPYVTVMKQRNGKYEIIDGYTRTAIAAPLGVVVKAIVLTDDMFERTSKKSVKESKFFEKKFPTRSHKIIDNADINSIISRGSAAPTYYEAFKSETRLTEKAEHEEESGSAEPVSQTGLDVANAEPNSAVGFRNDPIPPKRVDVIHDLDLSDPNNPKKSYRLWCQYPVGGVSIHPAPHEPGLKHIEDLALFNIPGADAAIAAALDVPKNRPAHRGVNESIKKKSKINEKVVGLKFTIYHNSFTSAINNAIKSAESKGYEITEDERFDKIAVGPGRPKPGKTNTFTISLMKNGKPTKEALHIQVYGMESGKYELNAYIS